MQAPTENRNDCDPPPAEGAATDEERQRAETVSRLFRDHNRSLVSYLALRLRSVQEAKEVAQEAYVRVLQLDRPGADSLLRAYLFKVATNLAVDRLRQRRRRDSSYDEASSVDLETSLDEPQRRTLAREQLQALIDGLEELPEKCRDAFLLFRLDGLGQQEIATRLGVTERMVRNYITQALLYCRLRTDGANADQAREELKR